MTHCLSQKAKQSHLLSERFSLRLKQLDPYLQIHFLLWTDKFMSGYTKYWSGLEAALLDANGAMAPSVDRISVSVLPFHAVVIRNVDSFQSGSWQAIKAGRSLE